MRDMPIECCSMPMSPTVDSEKKDTHSTNTHIHHDNNGPKWRNWKKKQATRSTLRNKIVCFIQA